MVTGAPLRVGRLARWDHEDDRAPAKVRRSLARLVELNRLVHRPRTDPPLRWRSAGILRRLGRRGRRRGFAVLAWHRSVLRRGYEGVRAIRADRDGCLSADHGIPFRWRSRLVRAWVRSRFDRPAGPPCASEGRGRATVWRTGRGAGALAVLFMLAAETEAAGWYGCRSYGRVLTGGNEKWPTTGVAGRAVRLRRNGRNEGPGARPVKSGNRRAERRCIGRSAWSSHASFPVVARAPRRVATGNIPRIEPRFVLVCDERESVYVSLPPRWPATPAQ